MREKLQADLSAAGISAGFLSASALPYLNAYATLASKPSFPEALKASGGFSLPMFAELTEDHIPIHRQAISGRQLGLLSP